MSTMSRKTRFPRERGHAGQPELEACMLKVRHTLGPWYVRFGRSTGGYCQVWSDRFDCVLGYFHQPDLPNAGNAQLAAKAPEMLEMLEKIRRTCNLDAVLERDIDALI